uniref:Putative secreted protein n=1 Tax=Amblyomma triste TaxID=251400 RepID=A0A023G1R5_AMBTT
MSQLKSVGKLVAFTLFMLLAGFTYSQDLGYKVRPSQIRTSRRPYDPLYQHRHCYRQCDPIQNSLECPAGCQCFPETIFHWRGGCLDPRRRLPPGFRPRHWRPPQQQTGGRRLAVH